MKTYGLFYSRYGVDQHGVDQPKSVYWNLPAATLYEEALCRGEGRLAASGSLVVSTGRYTGRAANDKFIVRELYTAESIWWDGSAKAMTPETFQFLRRRLLGHLRGRDLFVQDCFAGADPTQRLPIRVITETAWHSLFARNLFIEADPEELLMHTPQFTVIHAPNFQALPAVDGTRSEAFIVISFAERLILIGGTHYAGEIKKSIFTVLNYLLPQQRILPMHCSANVNVDNPRDVALFFGLSGTGKTTLSTDPSRRLIGDDEHGWSERGVFNLEGGCYAKAINLCAEQEPEIHAAANRFGAVLENVVYDSATTHLNFHSNAISENSRAAYPIHYITNAQRNGIGAHPTNIIMLTCDAFGVLPPLARLTPEQAVEHFLAGYTARVAGTEKDTNKEGAGKESLAPQAIFSACFGAPFIVCPPQVYAEMFSKQIRQHKAKIWLVNTGWSGGPYGVGQRIKLGHTRALVRAALNGALDNVAFAPDGYFDLAIPASCPGVPTELLQPRQTWADPMAYDDQANRLRAMFAENARKFAVHHRPQAEVATLYTARPSAVEEIRTLNNVEIQE